MRTETENGSDNSNERMNDANLAIFVSQGAAAWGTKERVVKTITHARQRWGPSVS